MAEEEILNGVDFWGRNCVKRARAATYSATRDSRNSGPRISKWKKSQQKGFMIARACRVANCEFGVMVIFNMPKVYRLIDYSPYPASIIVVFIELDQI